MTWIVVHHDSSVPLMYVSRSEWPCGTLRTMYTKGSDESLPIVESSFPLFDEIWSRRYWITDSDPDYPKRTHPINYSLRWGAPFMQDRPKYAIERWRYSIFPYRLLFISCTCKDRKIKVTNVCWLWEIHGLKKSIINGWIVDGNHDIYFRSN